jgi:hypothetical protein
MMRRRVDPGKLAAVQRAYEVIGVPSDQLPYTEMFEELCRLASAELGDTLESAECWHLVVTARKRCNLPRLSR